MNNLEYEIILYNKNLTTELIEEIKILEINKEIIDKRIVMYNEKNFVIKYIYKYDLYPSKNAEFIMIEDIITNKLSNPHLIDIYALIKFNYSKEINQNVEKTDDDDHDHFGIVMPKYETLNEFLNNNKIDPKLLLSNILNILDLSIDIRNTYSFFHKDLKIDNILVKDNKFYLIDWEFIIRKDSIYFLNDRPKIGNTEMYPFYNATGEQFLIHSIGVLIIRILGYNNITYEDFMQNYTIKYILSNIPNEIIKLYEPLILNIFDRKYYKIEKLKDDINILLDNIKNG
jgi:hypothetical protein